MTDREAAESYLPLSAPVFQILVSVSDRKLHGYAIIQDIRERTAGEVSLTASTLYGAIKRLVETGMLVETAANRETEDPRRRHYQITPFGREVIGLEADRLERFAAMARAKHLTAGYATDPLRKKP